MMSLNFINDDDTYEILKNESKSYHDYLSLYEPESADKEYEEIKELLGELDREENELNELGAEFESLKKKYDSNTKSSKDIELENENLKTELGELETIIAEKRERRKNAKELVEMRSKLKEQILKYETRASIKSVIEKDLHLAEIIDKSQKNLIKSTKSLTEKLNDTNKSDQHYALMEELAGIQVLKCEKQNYNNNSSLTNNSERVSISRTSTDQSFMSTWYNISFINIPAHYLDCENNFENIPTELRQEFSKLSDELLDKYRMVSKKKRLKDNSSMSQITNNCAVVESLDDFKIIFDNYSLLLCSILSRKEIEDAKKDFAIDWVNGSQQVSLLINSKSSKIASIYIPKYYPLSGTSSIRLKTLTGYDNNTASQFQIPENLKTFSDWLAQLTELYNKDMISQYCQKKNNF